MIANLPRLVLSCYQKTLTGQEQHPLHLQEWLDLRVHTYRSECSKHSRDHETVYNHCMCGQWRELQHWYHLKLCHIHIKVDCSQVPKLFTWALAIGRYALIPSYYTHSQALPVRLHASGEKLGGAWEWGYHQHTHPSKKRNVVVFRGLSF